MKVINQAIEKDTRSFLHQLEEAEYFFASPHLPELPREGREGDDPYANKDGLVEFIVGNEHLSNKEAMNKLLEYKKSLIALTSIVADYVNRYAAKYGE